MRRVRVVTSALAVMLLGVVLPAHATTVTNSTSGSLDVEPDHVIDTSGDRRPDDVEYRVVRLEIGGAMFELEGVSLGPGQPSSPKDELAPPASITAATPPPSMLLLVGTGLAGLAGLVRRRLVRRH
jgi:hypothetical protein